MKVSKKNQWMAYLDSNQWPFGQRPVVTLQSKAQKVKD